MTAPLNEAETDYARRLAALDRKKALGPARGIIIGLALGIPGWVIIGVVLYVAFTR